MNSLFRITLENNGKIRPQPDREKPFAEATGAPEGIRTLILEVEVYTLGMDFGGARDRWHPVPT